MRDLVISLDKNKNGMIEFDEYVSIVIEQTRLVFKKIDLNHDDVISLDEFKVFMKIINPDCIDLDKDKEQLQELYDSIDVNGNG